MFNQQKKRSDQFAGGRKGGQGVETQGKHFPAVKNTRGWWDRARGPPGSSTVVVRPGQQVAVSQAADAQLERSRKKLAKSWELGRGTTLTEDIAFGNWKESGSGSFDLHCI